MEKVGTTAATPHRSALAALGEGFRDAVVVVVGGRGGIGREVVRQSLELGARVIVVSGSAGARKFDRDEFARTRATVLRADIRVPGDLRQLAAELDAAVGHVDVLVNSAGSSVQVPLRALELLTDDVIAEVFQSNAIGVLTTIRELVPLLRKGRDPVIVNVGSVAAWTGQGSNLAYAGAKAAVEAMSIGLAKALAPDIRVVGVAPSALETDFVKGRSAEFLDATIAATPLRRLTTVTEVASAVLCAARVLTATTGVNIAVDGGRHL
jgi:3-oxoacyl-[acyl-carrier protein] reductase